MFNFGVKFDRDKDERLKLTKGGDYRFTLRLKDGEAVKVSIEGFRYNPTTESVAAPVVLMRWGAMNIITLDTELLLALKAKVKAVVEKEAGQ